MNSLMYSVEYELSVKDIVNYSKLWNLDLITRIYFGGLLDV